ncbi:MAG TPA: hypothetical protein VGM86_06725 [Thermoanaerobaculia bacterium]
MEILLLTPGEEDLAETPGMKPPAVADEEDTPPNGILHEVGVKTRGIRSLSSIKIFNSSQRPGSPCDGRIVISREGLPATKRQNLVCRDMRPGSQESAELVPAAWTLIEMPKAFLPDIRRCGVKLLK